LKPWRESVIAVLKLMFQGNDVADFEANKKISGTTDFEANKENSWYWF